jgi:tRNA threonylcarbamoyladenosine biosynthesis protein TsaB
VILSIDTTSEWGSIALTEREALVQEIEIHSPDGFGHVLFPELRKLLDRHAVPPTAIECFAAASGPGSFTGVRVGLSAAKGLAEATGKKMVAVSNLRALASFGSAPLRAVALDARRGEVYGAVYDDRLNPVVAESVMKFPDWLQTLTPFRQTVQFVFAGDFFIDPTTPFVVAPRALAAAIGRIAWREFESGRALDPAAIDANYVRRSDAELFWKDPVTRSPSG